jgi:amino acid transporter
LLSLFKCFNGNFVAASRLVFALGRRGLIDAGAGRIHARHQTPSTAVLCIGAATAACMLLGDAILVPITEVGSVACAIGWSATCLAYLFLGRAGAKSNRIDRLLVERSLIERSLIDLSRMERGIAVFGLLVGIAMILMKIVPVVPGHFTGYEWLALGIWIALGAACGRKKAAVEN